MTNRFARTLATVMMALLFAAAAVTTSAFAQSVPSKTQIVVPRAAIETPYDRPSPNKAKTLGELFNHFIVYGDGERCGVLSLVEPANRNASGDAVFVLRPDGQPAACHRPGALISFVIDYYHAGAVTLHEKFLLEPGKTFVLENFAPEAPGTEAPGSEPSTPGAPAAGNSLNPSTEPSSSARGMARLTALVGAGLIATGGILWSRRRGTPPA